MFSVEDFMKMKEQNKMTIETNDSIICEKQKENFELEAENRAFDKLINFVNVNQETQENI